MIPGPIARLQTQVRDGPFYLGPRQCHKLPQSRSRSRSRTRELNTDGPLQVSLSPESSLRVQNVCSLFFAAHSCNLTHLPFRFFPEPLIPRATEIRLDCIHSIRDLTCRLPPPTTRVRHSFTRTNDAHSDPGTTNVS